MCYEQQGQLEIPEEIFSQQNRWRKLSGYLKSGCFSDLPTNKEHLLFFLPMLHHL